MATILLAVLGLIVGSLFIRLPYYIESPGTAPSVGPLIRVDPAHRHPVRGDVRFSTVALDDRVDPLKLVSAWLNPDADVVSRRDLTGGVSTRQFSQITQAEMLASQKYAIVVALRHLGYPVNERGSGVFVTTTQPHTPADGRLLPGDVIVGAEGHRVMLAQDLAALIHAHRPGATIALIVDRPNNPERTISLPLVACPADVCGAGGTGRSYLGLGLQTRDDKFDFPFKVDIDLNGVGGPSAGLAFAIGVLDTLSTGNLTGGHRVAVTGTIDLNGAVGPIGGVALKTVAVEQSGAEYFLVPKDVPGDEPQYSAAVAKARGHHLKVIAVGSLDDALQALRSIGGDLTGITVPAPGPA